MSGRASLSVVLCAALASSACTSKDIVAPRAVTALGRSTTADFIRLPTDDGGSVEFGPNATLHIEGRGDTDIAASDLYTNEVGLFKKDGEPICSWSDLRSVRIEQPDGAADVAIVASVAVVIVALAAILKGSPSLPSGKSGSSGNAAPKPQAVRSAPNPPSVAPDPAITEVMFRTAEVFANGASGPNVTVGVDDEPEPTTAMPLFSRGARRRANVRALARLEGGACWPGEGADCILSGARAGVRLLDFFELSGGVRVESNATQSRPMAVFGAMLHGESPAAHWFALAIGANVAFDDARVRVQPELAVRFRPVRGLWLGLVPIAPVYKTEDGSWTMVSGIELTGEL